MSDQASVRVTPAKSRGKSRVHKEVTLLLFLAALLTSATALGFIWHVARTAPTHIAAAID